MGAKTVSISLDDATYYILPGNSGEFSNEAGTLDDTIFGQSYKSTQTGLINWMIKANGLYKGFAGYVATIKKSGSSTATTGEACGMVSTRVYQVTNTAKRVMDRLTTPVVKDGVTDVTAQVLSIDYLFGIITFVGTYTVLGSITMDYHYLPMTQIAKAQEFTLTQTAAVIDNTVFETAQANSGHRTCDYGLKTVGLDLNGVYALFNGYRAALEARSELVIDICPDGSQLSVARGFFKPINNSQSGNVGALEKETNKFELSVPSSPSTLLTPFNWQFDSSSTLSLALQKALNAWVANTTVYAKYLSDGVAGVKGSAIITDMTLKGGIEAMNEFTVNFNGSGQLTSV